MTADPTDQSRRVAVEQLKELGLSTYAARTFVALVSLGEGTAQDVSHVSDVPRTRVYDAAEELREWGLVDERQASPKRFWPVSAETAERTFRQEYAQRVDALTEALDTFEVDSGHEEQRGVWTVTGRDVISNRVVEFIEAATDEVVYMTTGALLDERVRDALSDAADRGVEVRLAGLSDEVETDIQRAVPEAELFESLWNGSDVPAGRLLLADDSRALVSVLTETDAGPTETAIWGVGETNSLLLVVRALFTWRRDER
jgi:sugar-specific transcriptional regulator TrmB